MFPAFCEWIVSAGKMRVRVNFSMYLQVVSLEFLVAEKFFVIYGKWRATVAIVIDSFYEKNIVSCHNRRSCGKCVFKRWVPKTPLNAFLSSRVSKKYVQTRWGTTFEIIINNFLLCIYIYILILSNLLPSHQTTEMITFM